MKASASDEADRRALANFLNPSVAAQIAAMPPAPDLAEWVAVMTAQADAEQAAARLSRVLDEVVTFLTNHVVFASDMQVVATALWVAHTHFIEDAETSPILAVLSPEKRSGKTRLLDCLELLVARPWRVISPSGPVFYRKIAADQPTVLLDEADAVFGPTTAAQHEDLRAVLNAGNRRGTTVPRCVGEGSKMQVKDFPIFSPKAIAGIGRLPDTVTDRSIIVRLRRRAPHEHIGRFRHRDAARVADPIRAELAEIAAAVHPASEAVVPDQLGDRAADGWEELLRVADLAGNDWAGLGRVAAVALSGDGDVDEESSGVRLLADAQAVFAEQGVDRLSTVDLIDGLLARPESGWADYGEHGLRPFGLARILRRYGAKPEVIRIGAGTVRGYHRAALEDAWKRYLPSAAGDPEERNNVTAKVAEEVAPAQRYVVTDQPPLGETANRLDGEWDGMLRHSCTRCGQLADADDLIIDRGRFHHRQPCDASSVRP